MAKQQTSGEQLHLLRESAEVFAVAGFSFNNGDDAGFKAELRAGHLVLHQMHERGLHFDPQLAQVYQQLTNDFGD